MGLFQSLAGKVRLELTSADKEATLRQISEMGVEIMELANDGELSVRFTVSRRGLPAVKALTQRKGERLIVLERRGLFWPFWSLRRRPVLVFGLLAMMVLSFVIPSRVLFVNVEGNEEIPERLILEAAQSAGIRFGASRRAVRSERMKNELLGTLPQLQWAGVNTYGCTAVISVRERSTETKHTETSVVSSIVASCDGVITSCTATSGNALCSVGQAVRKGQLLISGYVDNGLTVTATRASGEIFAQTQHELTAVMPSTVLLRGESVGEKSNFSLILGKKRINFMKGSGISDGTCVKMCTEYHLTLPGGYRLPVVLIKETIRDANVQTKSAVESSTQQLLEAFAKDYLRQQMVALTILDVQEEFGCAEGLCRLTGRYACTEMIGREQSEQIGDFHGKTD